MFLVNKKKYVTSVNKSANALEQIFQKKIFFCAITPFYRKII